MMIVAKRFFSLEGIDGSGKTTQLKLLAADLESMGYSCVTLREPGGSKISERIRDLLLDKRSSGMSPKAELLLYNAARAQVIAEVVRPALDAGKIVLADRFAWSTLAYQGYGRQLDIDEVAALSELTCGGCFPELTVVLDVPAPVGKKRRLLAGAAPDRLEAEADSFFERVRAGYLKIAKDNPDLVAVLDATEAKEVLHEKLLNLVIERIS